MAYQNRIPCFICNQRFHIQRLSRIDREDDINIREVAITRRDARDLPAIEVTDQTRLCMNCRLLVIRELEAVEADPACVRYNILLQRSGQLCFICNARHEVRRLPLEARLQIFLERDIYVPQYTKTCQHHLTNDNLILLVLLPGLQYFNRPYVIPGQDTLAFLQGLKNKVKNSRNLSVESEYTDEEFKIITSLTKAEFNDLLTFCERVQENNVFRYIYKKDLITFLCKLRQGLSDEFLRVIFNYTTRQAVSMAIANVRRSLMVRFVPQNVGFQAITRQEYIERHVTPFANELYNPDPQTPRVIAVVDGTYSYIDKSSNFRALRQSFCLHKGRHLVKPALLVAPDGYILTVQGPYFSDSRNNDAQILINEFETDVAGIREWLQEGDILVVDRGYRDAEEYLREFGLEVRIPHTLERGHNQLATEEANENRLITKVRWVVESRNGHIKSLFKFFDQTIESAHILHLQNFYLIAAALINRFHPPIQMADADVNVARRMLEQSRAPNLIQQRVENEGLIRRRAQWIALQGNQVRFPHLTVDYLRNLTFGTYQISLAPSYVQDKLQHEDDEEFQLNELMDDESLLHVRVYSRFRNRAIYHIFIQFNPDAVENVDRNHQIIPILGHYCTCKSGARTLGSCAHIASVLWYLGFARHEANIQYPSANMLNHVIDAGHRLPQINPNDPRIIEG